MSAKYHINKSSGRSNICRATVKACPVGGEHFDNKKDADRFIQTEMKNEHGELATLKRQRQDKKKAYEDAFNERQARKNVIRGKANRLMEKTPGMFNAIKEPVKYRPEDKSYEHPNGAIISRSYYDDEAVAEAVELTELATKVRTEDFLREPEDQKRFSELYQKAFPKVKPEQVEKVAKIFSSNFAVGDPAYIFRNNQIKELNSHNNDIFNGFESGGTKRYNKAEEKTRILKNKMKTEYNESTVIRYSDVGKGFKTVVDKIFNEFRLIGGRKRSGSRRRIRPSNVV